jgi:DNA-directed RNA polymerase subunit N (RpoN/RPB10)
MGCYSCGVDVVTGKWELYLKVSVRKGTDSGKTGRLLGSLMSVHLRKE